MSSYMLIYRFVLCIVIFMNINYSSNVGSTQNEGDTKDGGKTKEIALNQVFKGKTDMGSVVISKTKAKAISAK